MLFIGFISFFVLSAIIRGATIDTFWSWFVNGEGAPFTALPDLTFVQALGLSLIVTLFVFTPNINNDDDDDMGEVLAKSVIISVALYGFWWVSAIIIHGLM